MKKNDNNRYFIDNNYNKDGEENSFNDIIM